MINNNHRASHMHEHLIHGQLLVLCALQGHHHQERLAFDPGNHKLELVVEWCNKCQLAFSIRRLSLIGRLKAARANRIRSLLSDWNVHVGPVPLDGQDLY